MAQELYFRCKKDFQMRTPRKHYSKAEKEMVINMWKTGAGRVAEISAAMSMPKATIYGILDRAGVWPGIDDPSLAKGMTHKSELQLLLDQNPGARRRAQLNATMKHSNSPEKMSTDLVKFAVDAVKAGFNFHDVAEVCNVDAKTIAKYTRKFADVPARRISKTVVQPVKLAEAQQMSLPIQYTDEPKRGVLRRLWHWLFG